jgi:hypothetical protein
MGTPYPWGNQEAASLFRAFVDRYLVSCTTQVSIRFHKAFQTGLGKITLQILPKILKFSF